MDTPKIYESISKCMEEIGAINKDTKSQKQGYMYRGIDAVYNALQPVLIKNHVFVVPEVLDQYREERKGSSGGNLIYSILKVKYTFYAEDGSYVCATVTGEGMDSGDKASNKAMSAAFKYACFQTLCIPTDEMKDSDAETPPASLPAAGEKIMRRDILRLAGEFGDMRGRKANEVMSAVWEKCRFAPSETIETLELSDLKKVYDMLKKWIASAEKEGS